jgi:hypothetical protein
VLAGVNAWLLSVALDGNVGGNPTTASERASTLSAAIDGVPGAKPITAYDQTLAHPIFSKSREPYVPPPPAPPPPPQVAKPAPPPIVDPGLTLGGIVITDESKMAFVISRTDPRGLWLKEGEDFQGWKLKSIETTGATLNQQDRSIELQLYGKP